MKQQVPPIVSLWVDPSEVLVVQVVFSAVPTCLGDNGSAMRRYVQLVGAAALLGIHVDGVAQLGDHYALFESAVGPL